MDQQDTEIDVTETLQIFTQCNEMVTKLVQYRKQAGFTQEFMASWLKVSRKKLNEFESGKFDFKLMVEYADKLGIDLELKASF